MLRRKLELWDTFYNSNGYLSLVYKIVREKAYLVNYNGSMYSINRDTGKSHYTKLNLFTPDDFFDMFPLSVIENWEDKNELSFIEAKYRIKPRDKKLLLII